MVEMKELLQALEDYARQLEELYREDCTDVAQQFSAQKAAQREYLSTLDQFWYSVSKNYLSTLDPSDFEDKEEMLDHLRVLSTNEFIELLTEADKKSLIECVKNALDLEKEIISEKRIRHEECIRHFEAWEKDQRDLEH